MVEAKRGLMIEHRPQLIAELYSINIQNQTDISYGILTDGFQWEFYKLYKSGICKKTRVKYLDQENIQSWEIIAGLISTLISQSYEESKELSK